MPSEFFFLCTQNSEALKRHSVRGVVACTTTIQRNKNEKQLKATSTSAPKKSRKNAQVVCLTAPHNSNNNKNNNNISQNKDNGNESGSIVHSYLAIFFF